VTDHALTLGEAQRARLDALRRGTGISGPATTIAATGRDRGPLSAGQERIWFLNRFLPGEVVYNIAGAYDVSGDLSVDALQGAVDALVHRHAGLRTRFEVVDDVPHQLVDDSLTVEVTCVDVAPDDVDELLRRYAREPFDLAAGPLLRVRLARTGPDRAVLAIVVHHIVADGWSVGVFVRELAALYRARLTGGAANLPPVPVTYLDYTLWQRDRDTAAGLAFWRELLVPAPRLIALPTDRPRPAVQTFTGARLEFAVPPTLAAAVADLARTHDATPYMVLLAGYYALLHRWTGQPTVTCATPVANRPLVELDPVIGFFVNTLAIPVDVDGAASFAGLLAAVRARCLAAFEHQDVPFERLVSELALARELSHNSVAQVMFILQSAPAGRLDLTGAALRDRPLHTATTKFDVTLELTPGDDGLLGALEYSTDLYDEATMRRFADHYVRLLEAMTADSGQAVGAASMLTAEERTMLAAWNDTQVDFGPATTVSAVVAARVAAHRSRTAVVADGVEWTYADLADRAGRVANLLRALGVRAGTPVGLCLTRGPQMVTAVLGVLAAGGCYVPFDPEQPAERIGRLASDSAAPVVLTTAADRGALAALPGEVRIVDLDGPAPAGQPTGWPAVETTPDDLAYVIYTSGSTGAPKGVMVEHRAIVNRIAWMQREYRLEPDDRVMQKTTYTFDVSVWEFLWPLMYGATMVVAAPDAHRDPALLMEQVHRHGVTHLHFVPTVLAAVLRTTTMRGSPVRRVICSGEALPGELCERLYADCGIAVDNLYGPTECAVDVTYHGWRPGEVGPPPIGRPVANTRAYVVDTAGHDQPVGLPGELWIGGVQLARGYLGHPDLTAERFITRPDGERVYRTGDMVRRRADGALEYLGRIDDQVKLRGIRIEPGEVEAALREDPAVGDAAVVCVQDRLVAYVVTDARGLAGGADTDVRVGQWGGLFDRAYDDGPGRVDGTRNFKGWVSSYTREAIPQAEMDEWLEATVARIRGTGARRVLEIGCGTGLLLLALAGQVDRYVGTDISRSGLDYIAGQVRRHRLDDKVELRHLAAHEIDALAPARFDCVVLNSVVQYFPDRAYLDGVLKSVADLLAPGGVVFLGDLRHPAVAGHFHRAVVDATNPDAAPALREMRASRRAAEDVELLVDPAYFTAHPAVRAARTMLKAGTADNELTRYRYDVLLSFDAPADPVDDRRPYTAPEDLDRAAGDACTGPVAVEDTPNGRLVVGGWDPDALTAVAARHGVDVHVTWAPQAGPDGRMSVVFRPGGTALPPTPHAPAGPLTSDPAHAVAVRGLPQRLRERARRVLPAHMVPAAVVVLSALPLTSSGKTDRKALAGLPVERRPVADGQAPRTPTEHLVARVWRDVLGVDAAGPQDNFFDLGGDSIKSTQVAARLRAAGHPVMIRSIFANQTLGQLAALLDHEGDTADPDQPGRASRASRAADGGYGLSPLQEHMLRACPRPGTTGVYTVQRVVRLRGTVDVDRAADAWADVVADTPFLRTVLASDPMTGDVRQQVLDAQRGTVTGLDWSGRAPAERVAAARRFLAEDRARGFDPAGEAPTRFAFARTGADEACWIITMDYRRLDGWSFPLYLSRFLARYHGGEGTVHEFDYRTYETWRAARLDGARRWWRGAPTGLATFPVPEPAGFHVVQTRLTGADTARLAATARTASATVAAVVEACWGATLTHLDGRDAPQFGLTTSGRTPELPGIETALGMFMNTLPVRWNTSPTDSLRQWVTGAAGAALDLLDNDMVALGDLGVAPGRAPFDSYLVYQNTPGVDAEAVALDGFEIVDEAPVAYAQQEHRLRVDVYPSGDGPLDVLLSGYEDPGRLGAYLTTLRDLLRVVDPTRLDDGIGELLDAPAPPGAPPVVATDDCVAAMVTGAALPTTPWEQP